MVDQRINGLQAPGLPRAFPGPDETQGALGELLGHGSKILCDWLEATNNHGPRPVLSVQPLAEPGDVGKSMEQLWCDLAGLMDGAYRPNHPGALAHLDPPSLGVSICAEMIAAGLNNNLLAEELSPSLSRLERSLCSWIAREIGLGDLASGVPASGGSLSNLMALVCARRAAQLQKHSNCVVITGAGSHVSLNKALAVMGIGADCLWRLPLDSQGRLKAIEVAAAFDKAQKLGLPILAVVATAGTTIQGLVDPIGEMAALCKSAGVWLHVDGAIGGVCALVESERWRVEGIGLADSVSLNPQKLLGVSKPSSLLLLKDPAHLKNSFSTGLPYMEPPMVSQGGELGLQGTRGAEVLKLWMSLQYLGLEGIENILQSAFSRASILRNLLESMPLQLLAGDLHLLSFTASGMESENQVAWRDRCHRELLTSNFWLSKPNWRELPLLKAVLGNPYTSSEHLQQLASVVKKSLI
ncbi:pyridoxal phosphate-dependent decarboxylase family protein [Synechococcus lacustris]|uniref:pyridoxal phosphate-dependent decarboxylase family protein n=1 Tax=Synechococcus lacustris TaxID=2116544 RepID=UPI0020CC57F9|nr:aminotransferase class V-fold PLP-dependent enzyme [Synechococcus lacustris]MCP9793763.1 aspartate aminotransferase family protein [Synechococcus lacustris L1F-Slac]